MMTYQKQLPYSLKSSSFAWFLTVVKASPVAFLWYVFLEESPPWLVSVIVDDDAKRTGNSLGFKRAVKQEDATR